ncbi:MAG TPA: hypothetical protein VIG95_05850 [Gemmatimonadales bacterium]
MTVPHFQEELDQLKARLLEMGGLAEERVRAAVPAARVIYLEPDLDRDRAATG